MHIYRATFVTLLLSHHIHAIEVDPSSGCSFLCDDNATDNPKLGDSSHTISDDLVCNDDEFSSTVVGRKFKECLICELNNATVDTATYPEENYAYWHIFNMKFNIDWCVFGYPNNSQITKANSQCSEVCSGSGNSARAALVNLLPERDHDGLQYCQDGDGAFSTTVDNCMKCLNDVPKAKTLANFVNALKVACAQQPRPGEKLKLDFDVFAAVPALDSSTSTASSAGIVTGTVTPANPPSSSSAALAAPSSSRAVASASAAAPPDNRVRVGVGVGVGGGAALVLAVTAIILFRGRSTHNREVFEGEAQARGEAEQLAAYGVPNSNHQPHQEQNVEVAELISPDYSAGVAEFIAPDHWAGVAEFSASDCLAEADGRRLDPELAV
ncbi:hypothetical protein MMC07_005207 [Pseudocyphellaria aurata]|nr:hypothetical protein [Pseudocyphellaria aurata]